MDGQWWIVNFDIGTGRRAAATALAAAGLLFALYPAVRPYSDETAASGAAAFASGAWVASHLFAMAGFILLVLGLLGLRAALSGTPGNVTADAALVVTWLGVGLTLPYYGAETFALNALGVRAVEAGDPAVLGLADPIRFGAAQATMFAAGLAGLAAGAVLAAVAIRRSGVLPRWSGVPLAAGMVCSCRSSSAARRCGSHTACSSRWCCGGGRPSSPPSRKACGPSPQTGCDRTPTGPALDERHYCPIALDRVPLVQPGRAVLPPPAGSQSR